MQEIAAKLQRARLFSNIPPSLVGGLIEQAGVQSGAPGASIATGPSDVVVLVEGGLAMTSGDGAHLAAIKVDSAGRDLGILYAVPSGAKVMLSLPSRFVVIDGEALDFALSHGPGLPALAGLSPEVKARVEWMRLAQPFRHLPLDDLYRTAEAMVALDVGAGEVIVRAGEKGAYFYAIEQGRAEVWRPAPDGGEPALVATLGPGATFGEEALLQEGLRNATVRMASVGRILQLPKADFDRLIGSHLVHEIAPEDALERAGRKSADIVDCRHEDEYELWRIPGARLIPLDAVRERARGLDPRREYLVYCRSGRRSRAAAFLMRQQGLNAVSIRGGIGAWPFEIEGAAVDT